MSIHAKHEAFTRCGLIIKRGREISETPNCKQCLASLAKRDRAFRCKARRGIGAGGHLERVHMYTAGPERALNRQRGIAIARGRDDGHDAARAIAREEGRAL